MNISSLIQVLESIVDSEGDLKVYRADDTGRVNRTLGTPSILLAKILSIENPVVVNEEQLEEAVEEKCVVIM